MVRDGISTFEMTDSLYCGSLIDVMSVYADMDVSEMSHQ
jgi:hypothetical protein